MGYDKTLHLQNVIIYFYLLFIQVLLTQILKYLSCRENKKGH